MIRGNNAWLAAELSKGNIFMSFEIFSPGMVPVDALCCFRTPWVANPLLCPVYLFANMWVCTMFEFYNV